MVHFCGFDLHVVTPSLACTAALFGDPAAMHPLSTSLLVMLAAEGLVCLFFSSYTSCTVVLRV